MRWRIKKVLIHWLKARRVVTAKAWFIAKFKKWRSFLVPLGRWSWYLSAGLLVLLAIIFTIARLWLPSLVEHKSDMEDFLSEQSAYVVRMDSLDTYWEGPNPGLRIYGFRVYSATTLRQAVYFNEVRISLAWLPLLTGNVAVNSLTLVHPSLTVERLMDGRIQITGLDPVEAKPPEREEEFIRWLLKQKQLVVEDGEILWLDQTTDEAPLYLKQAYISLQNNGKRRRFGLKAVFPKDMCQECLVVGELNGNPFADKSWKGKVHLRAVGLNTQTFPYILREQLPPTLQGKFDLRLWSEWKKALPVLVYGQVRVRDLHLPVAGFTPIQLKFATAEVDWTGDPDVWRLTLDDLQVALHDKPWSAGRLRFDHRAQSNRLFIKDVNLEDVSAFLTNLPQEAPAWEHLRTLRPTGRLHNFKLALQGPITAPTDYSLETNVEGLHTQAYAKIPGIQGLSGRLSMQPTQGEFELETGVSRFTFEQLLPEPVLVRRARAHLRWRLLDDLWRLDAKDIRVDAEDVKLWGSLEWRAPKNPQYSPVLNLRLDFREGRGAQAARYYPNTLSEGLRDWLGAKVKLGRIVSGHVVYNGAVREFPFREGNGKFEVYAHVAGGEFEYLSGWPPMQNIEADLLFRGPSMIITANQAKIRELSLGRVSVVVNDLGMTGGATAQASGQVAGDVDNLLTILHASSPGNWSQYLPAGLRGDGQGVLALDFTIPLRTPHETQFNGLYRFQQGGLHFTETPGLEALEGELRFSETGILDGSLVGRLLGGPVNISLQQQNNAGQAWVAINAQGKIFNAGIKELMGAGLAAYVEGEMPWSGQAQVGSGMLAWGLEADMQALKLSLPPPLNKPAGKPLNLAIKTLVGTPSQQVLSVALTERLRGKLALTRVEGGPWRLAQGHIGLGEGSVELSEAPGLHVSLRGASLDADQWWRVVKSFGDAGREAGWTSAVQRISTQVLDLHAFARPLGVFEMDIFRQADGWRGHLGGDALSGTVLWQPAKLAKAQKDPETDSSTPHGAQGDLPILKPAPEASAGQLANTHPVIYLFLDKFLIPPMPLPSTDTPAKGLDPRNLPEMHIKSASFRAGSKNWGSLDFHAKPTPQGWNIHTLQLNQAIMNLNMQADWRVNDAGAQQTQLNGHFTSSDLGQVLAFFGYADEVTGGKADVRVNWAWKAAPLEFALARADGDVDMVLTDGRLLQIKQGAGRLLGVVDLASLTRYLALDFSHVFGKGFAFDTIRGKARLENGDAYTRDLLMKGPSAQMHVIGRIGLASRDMDLDIEVTPRIGDELTVTGLLLGGPIIGAAVAVAKDILKKPLQESTRLYYTVKGDWDDPQVQKVTKQNLLKFNKGG